MLLHASATFATATAKQLHINSKLVISLAPRQQRLPTYTVAVEKTAPDFGTPPALHRHIQQAESNFLPSSSSHCGYRGSCLFPQTAKQGYAAVQRRCDCRAGVCQRAMAMIWQPATQTPWPNDLMLFCPIDSAVMLVCACSACLSGGVLSVHDMRLNPEHNMVLLQLEYFGAALLYVARS